MPRSCPHDLFQRADGARGSALTTDFLALDRLIAIQRQNTATETAALIIPSVGSNHERHARLQRFMLVNDSSTIAVEVPTQRNLEDIMAWRDLKPRGRHTLTDQTSP